jgi:hypothetical protein
MTVGTRDRRVLPHITMERINMSQTFGRVYRSLYEVAEDITT